MMQFQENSRIDLEDLLYDGQEPAVSERNHTTLVWVFCFQQTDL